MVLERDLGSIPKGRSMKEMEKLFFELIRVAIGDAFCLSHTPTNAEWQMLYEMAKKQSLVGICFVGVQRLQMQQQCPPEVLYLQWMGMAAKIQQRNEVVNRQCAELAERLKLKGYRCCILKGQGVASLYRLQNQGDSSTAGSGPAVDKSKEILATLRQSGDIDLWVDTPKEKVVTLAEKMGITEKAGYLHVGTKFKGVDVELHYRPTYMRNPSHNRRIQEWCGAHNDFKSLKLNAEGLEIVVPSDEFNVVYLLSHIYRHLFGAGIGLRQLMDYYFVLINANCRELSANCSVNSILKSLGLFDFAGAVMYVLQVVFGMDEQYMICKPDEKRGKELLWHVMQTGNFGKMDKEQKVARQSLFGTMAYKVRQWWLLLRYYPSETIWSPYWAIVNRLNIL